MDKLLEEMVGFITKLERSRQLVLLLASEKGIPEYGVCPNGHKVPMEVWNSKNYIFGRKTEPLSNLEKYCFICMKSYSLSEINN